MNILFAVSEIEGIIKTGGLADVAKYLPKSLNDLGQNTAVIIPFYRVVAEKLGQPNLSYDFILNAHKSINVLIHEYRFNDHRLFCVDIPECFDRAGIYSDDYHAYEDNGERFSLFSLAVLDFFEYYAERINFAPDIIHCNDWHTSVLPAAYKSSPYWHDHPCKIVLSIHNGAFQGIFTKTSVPSLLNRLGSNHHNFEHDVVNFLKLGIIHADSIVAVSPNYAAELQTELGSHHLYEIFAHNKHKMSGILNGCDYQDWSAESDPYIAQNYDVNHLENKCSNKLALQKMNNLPESENIPVITQVCRLTDQKGLSFLLPAIKELVQHNVQICIAGTGDPVYVDQLEYLSRKHPDRFHFYHGFSEAIAHQYMAGSDFFLVPSLFEPCGLTQMYALAYGVLPIVREVGGLKDTVVDLSKANATGVVFKDPDTQQLTTAIRRGLLFYHEFPDEFKETRKRAMSVKFLWQDSALKYLQTYENLKP